MTTFAAQAPPAARGLTGRKVFLILAGFFGTIASADAFLIVSAVRSWSGAQATSAYNASQLYNGEIALARAQGARHWTVTLRAERERDGAVRVTMEARDGMGRALAGRTIAAVLQRPTDQRLDRRLDLVEAEPGVYVALIDQVAPGQWDLVADVLEGGKRAYRRQTRLVLP